MQNAKCRIIFGGRIEKLILRRWLQGYYKIVLSEGILCQTRSRVRSIVNLCEQLGYRSLTKQTPLKIDFYRAWEMFMI